MGDPTLALLAFQTTCSLSAVLSRSQDRLADPAAAEVRGPTDDPAASGGECAGAEAHPLEVHAHVLLGDGGGAA